MTDQNNEVESLIGRMADSIKATLQSIPPDNVFMIGIRTGGVWIAQRLHEQLGLKLPLGVMDISFYRDDFSRIGMNPQVKPTALPVSVDDKYIILVDDILHTGRTIRAAMNELFDYGRPAVIKLVVLGERSGRELPIQADFVGKYINLGANEHVKLTGPDNLALKVSATK